MLKRVKNEPLAEPPALLPQPDPGRIFWEQQLWNREIGLVAGLDEAGRGAWAGPVVAAAVVFKPGTFIPGIDDSKKIIPKKREVLFDIICREALCYAVGAISPAQIDEQNILNASLAAMREAVAGLSQKPDYLLIDGNRGIGVNIPQKLLVRGDGRSMTIGAASILAKVTRDRLMREMEKEFPRFTFSKHKGYGTGAHQEELKKYGILPVHRKSFEPIRLLANNPS
ncbi:MAG: ribonuclease HII [Deltaproteobacteria bacterium]|nr:ribonuclease HII [Deltaproteobacteria bacterium]